MQVQLHREVRRHADAGLIGECHDLQHLGDAADARRIGLDEVDRVVADQLVVFGHAGQHLAGGDRRVQLGGERRVAFGDFMTGPKKSVRRPDELIVAAEWEDAGEAQTYMFAATRNAMAISISGLALVVDRARRRVGVGLGSCGPTIIRATDAERFAASLFDETGWDRLARPSDAAAQEFGRLAAGAAKPIDDVRGTAAYRRHVLAVMGARALARVAVIP